MNQSDAIALIDRLRGMPLEQATVEFKSKLNLPKDDRQPLMNDELPTRLNNIQLRNGLRPNTLEKFFIVLK